MQSVFIAIGDLGLTSAVCVARVAHMTKIRFSPGIDSNQAAFDHVCEHLATQGVQATQGDSCVYWDFQTDHRCAIGSLVPEAVAVTLEEQYGGLGVDDIPFSFGEISMELLNELQDAHDSTFHADHLRNNLTDIADRWALDPAKVFEIKRWSKP